MNFNFEKAKDLYQKEFEKGKKVAKDMEKESNTMEAEPDDVYAKLEKMASLKAKGVITEEEFIAQKRDCSIRFRGHFCVDFPTTPLAILITKLINGFRQLKSKGRSVSWETATEPTL